ncbi:MAG TPA: hypothetical protein VEH50_00255 [Methylomirabilota bacterium]|nr:hypothetical protein [Methylomirabilota bacterium]
MAPGYQTIFEIGLGSFPWTQLLHPIPFVVVAFLLYRFSGRSQTLKAFGLIMTLVAGLFCVIAFFALVPNFAKERLAYAYGHSSVAEGTIESFHPPPALGPAIESFTVDGVPFSYNVWDTTPCFHNAPPPRGRICDGLYVRIHYLDGCIQRVDVRQ